MAQGLPKQETTPAAHHTSISNACGKTFSESRTMTRRFPWDKIKMCVTDKASNTTALHAMPNAALSKRLS
eukprot:1136571-Pelagomonas_calceolata.AAC.1